MQRSPCRIRFLAPLALACAAGGCGGESNGGGNCGPLTACGGDPTGVWEAQSTCSDFDVDELIADRGLPPECGDSLRVVGLRVTGTLSLAAGSYDESSQLSLDWDMRFDTTCISALIEQPFAAAQIPAFCDAYPEAVQSDPESPFSAVMCQVAGDECQCDAVQNEPAVSSGMFQIEGNDLVLDSGENYQFCVSADELVLEATDPMLGRVQVTYLRAAP